MNGLGTSRRKFDLFAHSVGLFYVEDKDPNPLFGRHCLGLGLAKSGYYSYPMYERATAGNCMVGKMCDNQRSSDVSNCKGAMLEAIHACAMHTMCIYVIVSLVRSLLGVYTDTIGLLLDTVALFFEPAIFWHRGGNVIMSGKSDEDYCGSGGGGRRGNVVSLRRSLDRFILYIAIQSMSVLHFKAMPLIQCTRLMDLGGSGNIAYGCFAGTKVYYDFHAP